jgi:hypothetical protein
MKYTTKRTRYGYVIGTGYKRKLTWPKAALGIISFILIAVMGISTLIVFLGAKMFILTPLALIAGATLYLALSDGGHNKAFPYKRDTWDQRIEVKYDSPTSETLSLLTQLLKFKHLKNFWDPDELSKEVFNVVSLFNAKELNKDNIIEYNESLHELIFQLKKAESRELYGDKELYNSNINAALEVAKKVNGELS